MKITIIDGEIREAQKTAAKLLMEKAFINRLTHSEGKIQQTLHFLIKTAL